MGAKAGRLVTVYQVTRRGFSLIELSVALGVMGMLAVLAAWGLSAARDSTSARSAGPVLSVVQLEVRRLMAAGAASVPPSATWLADQFPSTATILADVDVDTVTLTDLASTAPTTVSVHTAVTGELFLVAGSAGGCMAVVDPFGAAPAWLYDQALDTCTASDVEAYLTAQLPPFDLAAALAAGGTAAAPTEWTLS
jgi:prepilin-type N-terminal cleavage/methylation domain-containing protein